MALHFLAESAFDDLLAAWREHWRVQHKCEQTIAELGASRDALEQARSRMRRIRLAMYPSDDELSDSLVGALCPTLDEFVYLSWCHQFGAGSRQLQCPCGELVPLPKDFTSVV